MKTLLGVVVVVVSCSTTAFAAIDKPLEELPKDAWDIATIWTEPIKHAVTGARQVDPISGVWFGLLEGSAKSVERTVALLWSKDHDSKAHPSRGDLLRYSF